MRTRTGRPHIRHLGAAFDKKPRHQQLGSFVARHGDSALDGHRGERAGNRRHELVLDAVHFRLRNAAGIADRIKPRGRAIAPDRCRAHDRTTGGLELAEGCCIEGVHRARGSTVERGVQLPPLTGGNDRTRRESEGFEHRTDADRIRWKHLPNQRNGGRIGLPIAWRLHRAGLGLRARIVQHRPGEHVFRLGVGRHAKARHVDADDADAVYLFRQQLKRHAGGGRNA